MSSPNYVGRHRKVTADKKPGIFRSKLTLRLGAPLATAAAMIFGFSSVASADPVPVSWGDTFSGLVYSHCGTTDWQDVNFPNRDKNLIYAGETIDITCPGQTSNANIAAQNTPAPPAPTQNQSVSNNACANWIYPPSYWNDAQWNNARIIVQVGINRGVGRDGEIVALMAAMQESSLLNLNYGDRDSEGLFQQRPSMGWGTVAQVTDPWYASGKFYDGLVNVSNWWTLAKTWAAQDVQRSAYPYAYAQWETDATDMVSDITCS